MATAHATRVLVELSLIPTLTLARDLYRAPRNAERFRRYLDALTGGGDDLALPITAMNPMGKAHLLAHVEALLAMNAEARVERELAAIAPTIAPVRGRLRVAVVLADDIAGGWTHRYTTDAQHRFESAPLLERDFAVVLLFASEAPSVERLLQETRAIVLRAAYLREHGQARTLADCLEQERHVLVAAGVRFPRVPELAKARGILAARRDATDTPTIYACLYGDDAAAQLGYTPLGLPAWAGLALATTDGE